MAADSGLDDVVASDRVSRGFDPQPQDLVITLLGAYVRPGGERPVWSGGLVDLLADFGFTPGAARVALARLVNRQLLDRLREGRQVRYTLTPRARAILADGDRRIFALGRDPATPARWTMLWHAIPDDRRLARERFVRRLRFLGFGPVQDGAWLTPHDREAEIAALTAELDIRRHVGVLLGHPAIDVDLDGLLGRAWDLAALAERYDRFVADFARYADPAVRDALDDGAVFRLRTEVIHQFRQFPALDPELPADLAPAPASRPAAVRLFHELYPTLAPAAQRYFEKVTTP